MHRTPLWQVAGGVLLAFLSLPARSASTADGPSTTAASAPQPPLQAGLWQVRSRTTFDGERNLTLSQQLAELPAEQRDRVQKSATHRGLALDGTASRTACLTPAAIAAGHWHPIGENCTVRYGDTSGAEWRWNVSCPRADTEARAHFEDPQHYTLSTVVTVRQPQRKVIRTEAAYTWQAADCSANAVTPASSAPATH